MTEQELRQLVRGVIAERSAEVRTWRPASAGPDITWRPASAGPPDPTVIPLRDHASHALFVIPAPGEACLIESAVTCNHCGYCKSYGH
jgi:hypothetical protein